MTEQPKEYYEKKPGFVVKSGTEDALRRRIDYAVFTDNGQGFEYTQDGKKFDVCRGTSLEITGSNVNEGEFGKIKLAGHNIGWKCLYGCIVIAHKCIVIPPGILQALLQRFQCYLQL